MTEADAPQGPESTPSESQDPPPGLLPLGPAVFGKWAFMITAVPFLIYWGGTAFGSYIETTRKMEPVHSMRGICRGAAKSIREHLEATASGPMGLLPETQEMLDRFDFAGVEKAMSDEAGSPGDLFEACQTFLDADFSELDPANRETFERFRVYVEHFLDLKTMAENNDLDGIRLSHTAFVEKESPEDDAADATHAALSESWYPMLYTGACLSAFLAVLIAMPGYLKIPFRISPLAFVIGGLGIVVWIGLWWLDKEYLGIGARFSGGARAGFNPFDELKDNMTWAYTFLGIRLLGLVIVIPIAEEFFIRGFLMRYIEDIDWDQIPMGMATWKSIVGVVVYGAMAHPGEIVAAIIWFSMVTWLYLRTKNVWDCVVAHGLTNLLLAVFVIFTSTWELW